jgi:hypothetical protein
MTVVIGLGFISILASLGFALFFLMKRPSDNTASTDALQYQQKRTVWVLTLRIGLSVLLFGVILLGYYMGWIEAGSLRG